MFVGQPIEQSARKFFNKCQRCKLNNEGAPECELVGCEKNLKKSAVICSEVESIFLITLICPNTVV